MERNVKYKAARSKRAPLHQASRAAERAESRRNFSHFSRSTRFPFLCTFGIFVWEKPGKPHSEIQKEIEKGKQRKCQQKGERSGITITGTKKYTMRRND